MNDVLEHRDPILSTGARDELRLRVLRALEANPELSQRQLAAELGVSLGGVNYALKALVERGFVKAGNFRKSGAKAAYLYVLTPKGIAEKSLLSSVNAGCVSAPSRAATLLSCVPSSRFGTKTNAAG